MPERPSGTITFLFTDIEGSTRLWEQQPEAMQTALARHDAILRESIEGRGGYVFKTVGDAFCAAFTSPVIAVEVALAAQNALNSEPWPVELGGVRIRAALHTGLTEERNGDYFGPTLNRVARLLSAGHGGQTLITLTTRELVSDKLPRNIVLVDMGEFRLKDLLRSERIFQVNSPGLPSEFPSLKTLDVKTTNLPAQPTPFIGRDRDVDTILEQVRRDDVRLLTLTGPGGTGKTRLSLQVAANLLDEYKDGVWFVPLAETTDQLLALSKIAQVLEVREGSNQPLLHSLKDYLADKSLLLVLDNFEQLVSAAAFAAELLSAAPGLKLLITSQILLRIRGEQEYRVAPLATPDVINLPELGQLQQNESIQLFVQCAQSVNTSFALTKENASAIVEICRRLEGLPLAIELAAARSKLLSPQAMLAKLTDRLTLLTGGARDLPTRQQTLRNALDWSYSLLDAKEKTLFARLGIFVGGFDLEAAEAICGENSEFDVLGSIETLLNNSLLRQEESTSGKTRFRMLETIREYALEEMFKTGELATFKSAQALYYMSKVTVDIGFKLFSAESDSWLDWLETEHDNIRAALAWAQTNPAPEEMKTWMLFILGWFWYRRGYLSEGRGWADAFLEPSGTDIGEGERARRLLGSGMLALWQGDAKTAITKLEEGYATLQRLEDEQMLPIAFQGLGIAHINMGNDAAALPLLTQSAEMCKEMQPRFFYVTSLVHLGNAELGSGNPAQALELLEKAHPISLQAGDQWTITLALNNLGEVARVQGEYAKARKYYEQSETLLRTIRDHGDLARLVHSLGYVALHEGNMERAKSQFQESLLMFRKLGNKRGIAECMMGMSALKAAEADHRQSAQLFGAAEAILSETGSAWWPADRVEVERTRSILMANLDQSELTSALETGHSMSFDEVAELV